MINNQITTLSSQISKEIQQFQTEVVPISDSHDFSQYKLVRRINLFENHIYPTGKFDSQGNYKYWFDVINSRIDSEVKNINFGTKDARVYSELKLDTIPCLVANLKLGEYLKDTGQAEEINSAIEEGSGWGNVVWKKVKGGYERVDLKNFYVVNQTAKDLNETPAIERHQLSSTDLRAMIGVWDNVKEVLESCSSKTYKTELSLQGQDTTVPYYDTYERNGEVCLKDLKETRGEEFEEGDKDKYVLAKVIGVGEKGTTSGVEIKYILFADTISKMPYKEYHRSRYKGRWWREGLYELLFDIQVRANQIGNQIAQGLEYASKKVLYSPDKLLIQNIMTDMKNGDIVRASALNSVDFRMEGFDQLVAEWNRLINLANDIANSREVVQGQSLPSGTTLGAYNMLNVNANKLFVFIREKLAIPLSEILQEVVVVDLIKNLKLKDILTLTGDSDMLERLQEAIVEDWYLQNLAILPPHTKEIADTIKQSQLEELKKRPQLMMKGIKMLFDGFKPRVRVDITGESLNLDADLQTLSVFIGMEGDLVRRTALIEMAMKKKSIDVANLPKSPPQPVVSPIQSAQLPVAK